MNKKDKMFLAFIILVYILIPILILLIKPLFEYKFYILTGIGAFLYSLTRILKIPHSKLGITKNNIIDSLKNCAILNIILIVVIIVFLLFSFNRFTPNESWLFYIFYIFISCPIQEFLYRGIFGYFDQLTSQKYIWVITSSILYSFVHIIYGDILTIIGTFVLGILWYMTYQRNYNLLGVVLSHVILGILTISLGIIN